MSRWFRFYSEVLDDPKVQRLDGETFKMWVNILCLTAKNDGHLPPVADMAFALRIAPNACETVVERLLNGGLIDRVNGGANGWHYAPHGWEKRQYKSDSSNERVKRYRQRSKTVSETPPETDTETEKNKRGYAFEGSVIKLNQRDFARWQKAYTSLDLMAVLQSRDDWLSGQDDATRKKWFNSTSNWLASKQQAVGRAVRDQCEFTGPC